MPRRVILLIVLAPELRNFSAPIALSEKIDRPFGREVRLLAPLLEINLERAIDALAAVAVSEFNADGVPSTVFSDL